MLLSGNRFIITGDVFVNIVNSPGATAIVNSIVGNQVFVGVPAPRPLPAFASDAFLEARI